MLTFFPKPYPDELLYSIIARYHVWSGNDVIPQSMEELFDYRLERATLFIPKHLKRLAEKTKKFGLNYETLLYDHTIFPLVTCFLNKATYDRILLTFIKENQKENALFIYNNDIYPGFLRYCPHCFNDDRDEYGEAYWHRKHQSFGIVMCDKHKCRLKDSCIEVLDSRENRCIALELLDGITDKLEQEDISDYKIELQMAFDVDYIYKNYEFIRNLIWEKHTSIREATIAILYRRGLATKKGFVNNNKLRQEFQDRYVSTQLKYLMTEMNSKQNWLIKLCWENQTTAVPIRFILFADFLAGSLETFMKIINEQEQFIDRTIKVFQQPNGYEDKLGIYRRRCLDVWEKNPNGSRYDLEKADQYTYNWIRKYDKEWYLNNAPQIIRVYGGAINFKDWVKIDNELESMVDDAVCHIKNLVGKPEKITKTNIGRYMQQKYKLAKNYKLLPRTMYKIDQYVESTSDYQLRKIEWAKSELEKEGKTTIPYLIFRKAAIHTVYQNKFKDLFTL
ncbi:MAG: TniQ family protein [Mobilitalea sp.]